MMWDTLVVRYGEMSNKGNNKSDFEKALIHHFETKLKHYPHIGYRRISGRIVLQLRQHTLTQIDEIASICSKVFGVRSVSRAVATELDLEVIIKAAIEVAEAYLGTHTDTRTFKAEVIRANKQFPGTSMEIAREVGHQLGEIFPTLNVDVRNPQMTVWVEIREDSAYIYADRMAGPGGLPIGTGGSVGLLLSGGIDSPVAGWQTMRRGATVNAVHFHSFPFTSVRAQAKVEALVQSLSSWSRHPVHLYSISVTEVQASIQRHCPDSMRTIILRRMMLRIATELAKQQDWLALVTGDSLGQVASQTLEGLHVLDEVTTLPILRPLVTAEKTEIIDQAKVIGTYETSILPFDDCCSLFAPKSPRTRPTRMEAALAEQTLPIDELIHMALSTTVEKVISEEMDD